MSCITDTRWIWRAGTVNVRFLVSGGAMGPGATRVIHVQRKCDRVPAKWTNQLEFGQRHDGQ